MIVFIDLSNCLTDLQMGLEIIHPMALGAVNRNTAVGTFEMRVRGRQTLRGHLALARFGIVGGQGQTSLLMARMGAEGVLLDKSRTLSDCSCWRLGEGVK